MSSALLRPFLLGTLLLVASAPGCLAADPDGEGDEEPVLEQSESVLAGQNLFNNETFGGNGRRCADCHPSGLGQTGTLTPQRVTQLFNQNPNGPLFRHDAADTIGGTTFNRFKQRATVLIPIPLPPNVRIVGSSAREVLLPRGIPTTFNTPKLDPVLMYDGRAPNLQEQARDAIERHAQSTNVNSTQLNDIADFQKTLFNRVNMMLFGTLGTVPLMPLGITPSQKRGRRWFIDDGKVHPNDVGESKFNVCGFCHSGPMLNGLSNFFVQNISPVPLPEGFRFFTVLVSELNPLGNPEYQFEYTNGGVATVVPSADPGIFLITGETPPVGSGWFKIPTVWGTKDTAPYFHDNSAKDFTQMMDHYDTAIFILSETDPVPPTLGQVDLTTQDKKDIIDYMNML
jgi:hypothetical protein